ncbi:hypothetical protein ASZ90_014824 [hydrocarbon metagenome]|uniref:Uncharacterized protein n=1 Tax=hydrocarbon metagenome TaxID=938273 RepID=A0A0W8F3N4_9ZZZZ
MADRLSRLSAPEKMPPSGTCHYSLATVPFFPFTARIP